LKKELKMQNLKLKIGHPPLTSLKGGIRSLLSFKTLSYKYLSTQINNLLRSEIVVSPFEGGLRGMTLNLSEIQPTKLYQKTIFNSIQAISLKFPLNLLEIIQTQCAFFSFLLFLFATIWLDN
jgi:hypothetical protein